MDESRLIERLRLIEALYAGAGCEGERNAADLAKQRILARLRDTELEDPPKVYRFTMADMWSRKVFIALLRRYGLQPYRRSGQRYTTVMVRVSERFVEETLWPEFRELSRTLQQYLGEVTDRVVSQVLHRDSSDAPVVADQPPLRLEGEGPKEAVAGEDGQRTGGTTGEPRTARSSGATTTGSAGTGRGNRKKGKRKKRRR